MTDATSAEFVPNIDDVAFINKDTIRTTTLQLKGPKLPQKCPRVVVVAWCPHPDPIKSANTFLFGASIFTPNDFGVLKNNNNNGNNIPKIGATTASIPAPAADDFAATGISTAGPGFVRLPASVLRELMRALNASGFDAGFASGSGVSATASTATSAAATTATESHDTDGAASITSLTASPSKVKCVAKSASAAIIGKTKSDNNNNNNHVSVSREELCKLKTTALKRLACTPCTLCVPNMKIKNSDGGDAVETTFTDLNMGMNHVARAVFELVFSSRLPARGCQRAPAPLFNVDEALEAIDASKIEYRKTSAATNREAGITAAARSAEAQRIREAVHGCLIENPDFVVHFAERKTSPFGACDDGAGAGAGAGAGISHGIIAAPKKVFV